MKTRLVLSTLLFFYAVLVSATTLDNTDFIVTYDSWGAGFGAGESTCGFIDDRGNATQLGSSSRLALCPRTNEEWLSAGATRFDRIAEANQAAARAERNYPDRCEGNGCTFTFDAFVDAIDDDGSDPDNDDFVIGVQRWMSPDSPGNPGNQWRTRCGFAVNHLTGRVHFVRMLLGKRTCPFTTMRAQATDLSRRKIIRHWDTLPTPTARRNLALMLDDRFFPHRHRTLNVAIGGDGDGR